MIVAQPIKYEEWEALQEEKKNPPEEDLTIEQLEAILPTEEDFEEQLLTSLMKETQVE